MLRFILIVLLASATATAQENWPRFRGANGLGVAEATGIPVAWDDAHIQWRVKLSGGGHGSPVVWDDKVYQLVSDGPGIKLVCRDSHTGSELWTAIHDGSPVHLHALNSSASGTPAVDAFGVYVSWADGKSTYLAAYTHEGKEVWRKSLGAYQSSHGYSRSPILAGPGVVLVSNQQSGAFAAAYDTLTGQQHWRTPLPAGKASYGTPCVIDAYGPVKAIVTCSSGGAIHALHTDTGEVIWTMPNVLPERSVGSPVYADGLVLVTSGSGGGGKLLAAVEPPSKPSGKPRLVYSIAKAAPYVPTPLAVDDLLVLWHDRGTVAGFDLTSGDKLWEKRIGGKAYASPIAVGSLVLGVTMDGTAIFLKPDRQGCEVVARNELGEPTESTPAVAGGRLYLSTQQSLICIGAPATATLEEQKSTKETKR